MSASQPMNELSPPRLELHHRVPDFELTLDTPPRPATVPLDSPSQRSFHAYRVTGIGHQNDSPLKLTSPDEGFGDLNVVDYSSFTSPLRMSHPNSPSIMGYSSDFQISSLEADVVPLNGVKTVSPPTILRRGHRSRRRSISECTDLSPEYILPDTFSSEDTDNSFLHRGLRTPEKSHQEPIKQLPFSPSQFLNSPNLSFDATLASTPVKQNQGVKPGSPGLLVTPNPLQLRPQAEETVPQTTPPRPRRPPVNTPRTPTPFKNALAEIEKRSRRHSYTPQTPTRLAEDIQEIIKKDQDESDSHYEMDTSIANTSELQDSGYLTAKRKPAQASHYGKENTLPHKRVRKALAPSWSTPGIISVPGVTDLSFAETPSKCLSGSESSVLFSPPSIVRDMLSETDESFLHSTPHLRLSPPKSSPVPAKHSACKRIHFEDPVNQHHLSKLVVKWEMVAYGKTRDQLDLTEQAHEILGQTKFKPRSLAL
uniref:C-myb C-terminal domain-containing protein n=2 Tax=Graphocephala atropunctata TaxID=36148 RepID=A0A1B6LR02_9HEMI